MDDLYFKVFTSNTTYGLQDQVNLWIGCNGPIIHETHISNSMLLKDGEIITEYCLSVIYTETYTDNFDKEEDADKE